MFSVVIPVWNNRRTLARTVDTVLAQSYRDFELILVDDGSSDGAVETLAISDSRIRIIRQLNAGPSAARLRGVEAALHRWIAFLDADDLWTSEHLAELELLRARYPQAGLIGTSWIESDRNGQFELPKQTSPSRQIINYFGEVGRGRRVLWASSAAISKPAFAEVGGFLGGSSCGDLECWARLAWAGPVAASNRVTVVYVQGTNGMMATRRRLGICTPLNAIGDLNRSVAFLLERYDLAVAEGRRADIDRYIARFFYWRLRESVAAGNIADIRKLSGLYPRLPPPVDLLLLAVARLAEQVFRAGLQLRGHRV